MNNSLDPTQLFEETTRIRSLVHLAVAPALAKKDFGSANAATTIEVLKARLGTRHPHLPMLEKAAVAAGSPSGWPGSLAEPSQLSAAFMARQRRTSLLGRVLQWLRRVPFNVFVARVASGSSAEWAGSGKPVKVSALAFDRVLLDTTKMGVITVVTEELARSTDPIVMDRIAADLTTATVNREDEALLSHDAAIADVQPAGLLNGLVSVGGGSPDSIEEDVAILIGAVRGGEPEAPVLAASRSGARQLVTLRGSNGERLFPNVNLLEGGDIYGIPLLLSPGAGGNLVLFDAATLAVADGGVDVSLSTQSAIQMDDSPVDAPANLISLWQVNSVALKAVRFVNWQKGFSDSVAYLSLSGGSPS
jgi:HK97 family phage major capsid protein